jgi:hypothetical protein
MSLARSWSRALYGASGAALVVPATIAGALAVLALAGGFAGVGAIGQAFSGPPLPAGATASANPLTAPRASASLTRVLAAVGAPAPPGAATVVGVRTGGGRGPSAPRAGGGKTVPSSSVGPVGSGGGTGSGPGSGGTGGGSGGTGGGSGGGTGSGGSPSPPTVVDGIVKPGTSVTERIPGPVGSAGTNTLQSLGSTLNTIAPLRLQSGK